MKFQSKVIRVRRLTLKVCDQVISDEECDAETACPLIPDDTAAHQHVGRRENWW